MKYTITQVMGDMTLIEEVESDNMADILEFKLFSMMNIKTMIDETEDLNIRIKESLKQTH